MKSVKKYGKNLRNSLIFCNLATQRNATQRNATQRNATQRNATQRNATFLLKNKIKSVFFDEQTFRCGNIFAIAKGFLHLFDASVHIRGDTEYLFNDIYHPMRLSDI